MQNSYEDFKKYGLDDTEVFLFSSFFSSDQFRKAFFGTVRNIVIIFLIYAFLLGGLCFLIFTEVHLSYVAFLCMIGIYIFLLIIGFLLIQYYVIDAIMYDLLKLDLGFTSTMSAVDCTYKSFFDMLGIGYKDIDLNPFSKFDKIALDFLSISKTSIKNIGFRNISVDFLSSFKNILGSNKFSNNITWIGTEIISFGCGKTRRYACPSGGYLNLVVFDTNKSFEERIDILQEGYGLPKFGVPEFVMVLVISLCLTLFFSSFLINFMGMSLWNGFVIFGIISMLWLYFEFKSRNRYFTRRNGKLTKQYIIKGKSDAYIEKLKKLGLTDILDKFILDYPKTFDIILIDKKLYLKTKWRRFDMFLYKKSFINIYREFKSIRSLILDINTLLQKN